MDIQLFFWGVAFLLVGYLMYYYLLKNEKPCSKETNGDGMTGANYVSSWTAVIIFYLCGIVFILRSLPSQI